jgi:hypothetical protein
VTVLDTINEEVSKSMVSSSSFEDVDYVKSYESESLIEMDVYGAVGQSESVEDATAEPNLVRNES